MDSKIQIGCVRYKVTLPEWSSLRQRHHVSAADAINELYKEICGIQVNLSTKSLGNTCLRYDTNRVKDVLKSLKSRICT